MGLLSLWFCRKYFWSDPDYALGDLLGFANGPEHRAVSREGRDVDSAKPVRAGQAQARRRGRCLQAARRAAGDRVRADPAAEREQM